MEIPEPNEYAKKQGYNPFPPRWEKWLNEARKAILSAQPVAGRHVSVDEHPGKGTVINIADTSARRPGGGGGGGEPCDPPVNLFNRITIAVTVTCSVPSGGTSGSSSATWDRVDRPAGHEGDCTITPGEGGPDDGTFWLYSYRDVDDECQICLRTDSVNTTFGFFDSTAQAGGSVFLAASLLTIAFTPSGCLYGNTGWTQDSGPLTFTGPGTYNYTGHHGADTGTTYSATVTVS